MKNYIPTIDRKILLIPVLMLAFTITINPATTAQPLDLAPMGLHPDPGFPLWLTPDVFDYLPLVANQTSGLDWVATAPDENGNPAHWIIMCDDDSSGGIHLVRIQNLPSPEVSFLTGSLLTIPPSEISGLPVSISDGYDWESICLHPWSNTVFLAQEGHADEVALYCGIITDGDHQLPDGSTDRAGEIGWLPGHISNLTVLQLPGWDEAFGSDIRDNMGIEGIACTEDRLFAGLESPYPFNERRQETLSTKLAIWSINPATPTDMKNCELLAIHDTADWSESLGFTVETICGLDAISRNQVVGIDRDNTRLFTVKFSDSGEFISGRTYYLDVPGPAPYPCDECRDLDHLPMLVRPSLESVTVIPCLDSGETGYPVEYILYLAVDPWAPGWAVLEPGWSCVEYERRLAAQLPAIYRYTLDCEWLELPD